MEIVVKQRMGYRESQGQENCDNCKNTRRTSRVITCDLMDYEVDPKDTCDFFKAGDKDERKI